MGQNELAQAIDALDLEKQPPEEKGRLLHHVLSSRSWADGKLEVSYRKPTPAMTLPATPFDLLAEPAKSLNEGPLRRDSEGGLSSVGDTGFEPVTSTV